MIGLRFPFLMVMVAGTQGISAQAGGARPAAAAKPADSAVVLNDAERRVRFPRVYERRARGLGVIMLREEIARVHAADSDELFRRVPKVRALLPGRNVMSEDASACGAPQLFIDAKRTPPLAWESNRHRLELADFIDLADIEILEVHKSAELVAEPFLRVDMGAAAPENESYPRPIGAAPRRTVVSSMARHEPSCVRVVLLWTNQYQER
ncbi:MAG: hypothetical protein ACYC0B_06515 [Gemmatimonadaceae bacterium]